MAQKLVRRQQILPFLSHRNSTIKTAIEKHSDTEGALYFVIEFNQNPSSLFSMMFFEQSVMPFQEDKFYHWKMATKALKQIYHWLWLSENF